MPSLLAQQDYLGRKALRVLLGKHKYLPWRVPRVLTAGPPVDSNCAAYHGTGDIFRAAPLSDPGSSGVLSPHHISIQQSASHSPMVVNIHYDILESMHEGVPAAEPQVAVNT